MVQSNDFDTKSNQEMRRDKKLLFLLKDRIVISAEQMAMVMVMVALHLFSKMYRSYIIDVPTTNIAK